MNGKEYSVDGNHIKILESQKHNEKHTVYTVKENQLTQYIEEEDVLIQYIFRAYNFLVDVDISLSDNFMHKYVVNILTNEICWQKIYAPNNILEKINFSNEDIECICKLLNKKFKFLGGL